MPEPTVVPSVGDSIGRYLLERALGEGGMGTVFLARHAVTGRRVALKWMRSDDKVLRTRMLREARSMGRLSHPNVVGVLDAGEVDGAVFTVMDYVDGQNLRDYAYQKTLSAAEALDLLLPALSGVAAAHQAGILHRDLKPENLFVCLDHDGTPFDTKVLDFGVAKNIASTETTLTASGTIIGTPKYMAPEQIINGDDIDVRMDVYAMGVILYELLAGRLPYRSSGLKTLVVEILAGKLPHLKEFRSDVPPALCNAVMHALGNDREDRYATIADFARAVEPFAGRRRFEPPRHIHTPENTLDDADFGAIQEIVRGGSQSAVTKGAGAREVATAPTVRAPTPISIPAPQVPTKPRSKVASGEPKGTPTAAFSGARVLSESVSLPRSKAPTLVLWGLAFVALVVISFTLRGRSREDAQVGHVKPAAAAPEAGPSEQPADAPAAATPTVAAAAPAPPAATTVAPTVAAEPAALPIAAPPPSAANAPAGGAREPTAARASARRRPASASAVPAPVAPAPASSPAPVAAEKTVKVRGGTLTAKDF